MTHPMQVFVDGLGKAMADTRKNYHLCLGPAIKHLKQFSGHWQVKFDVGGHPRGAFSYRGYYEDLAISAVSEPSTVKEFLELLEDALGKTFGGYKGGEYRMAEDTPLWMAEYGVGGGRAIMHINDTPEGLVIVTKEVE